MRLRGTYVKSYVYEYNTTIIYAMTEWTRVCGGNDHTRPQAFSRTLVGDDRMNYFRRRLCLTTPPAIRLAGAYTCTCTVNAVHTAVTVTPVIGARAPSTPLQRLYTPTEKLPPHTPSPLPYPIRGRGEINCHYAAATAEAVERRRRLNEIYEVRSPRPRVNEVRSANNRRPETR